MNKMKKILSMLLCVSMALSNVQIVGAEEIQSEEQYKIYPIVRDLSYDGTEFTMDSKVNVVYEKGIDDATKAYLEEVLEENGMTVNVVDKAVSGKSNVLLGIDGSNGVVDTYENTISVEKENLYDEYEGYLLEAKDKNITIVGGDSDAVFRGVATLKMMLSSIEGDKLLGAQIEDYAGIEYRGFIEGFYGGWDYPTRADLMKFARDVKMNMYVYASKTDTYHTTNWAGLYPAEELAEIENLVKIGEETKCYYVWSVHLGSFFNGLNIANNPNLYKQRYDQLVAKFTQLYNVGVRKFDILNDDFGSGSHADVVTLLNDLTKNFIEPMGCEPITYCPQGYNEAWSKWANTINELPTLKNIDDSIMIYWTGADVNSPITQSTVDYVTNKCGQPVAYWLNYPVNEHAKSGVYLGNIDHYARDGVTGLRAAVSNPSRFGYSNKVALFQLAALFWNNSNYSEHSEDVWLDSFNYLEEGVEEAYRTIGRNLANCPNSSRVGAGFPESEYIKANLEKVLAAVANGETVSELEDTKILIAEFANILNAIETFRKDCKNENLVNELNPWLDSLTDAVVAAEGSLKSVIALEKEDYAEAWSNFAKASKAFQTWSSYKSAPDITNPALGGSKRIQPFASELVGYVESTLTPIFDSNYSGQNMIAVLGGQKQSMDDNAAKMFDGDENTSTQWNTVQKKDDYFGVDLGVVKNVTDICIVQGNNDADHDYFHKAVLEYSVDGKNYTQIGERYNDAVRIELDNLDIEARFVRLRLEETGIATKPDFWTHVREFTVNKQTPDGDRVYTNVEAYAKQPLTIEGKEYSIRELENVTLKDGEYLGIKFKDLVLASEFTLEGENTEKVNLVYSENGSVWNPVEKDTENVLVKYVAVKGPAEFDVDKLGVIVESTKADPKFLETNLTNGIKEGNWSNVFDGNDATYVWTNEGQTAGDYIIFDLGAQIPLYDVEFVTPDGNPRFYNAEIQISTDKKNWDTIAEVVNDNSIFEVPYRYVRANADGEDARYIRIYFTANSGYYFKLHEIFFNTTVTAVDETAVISASFGKDIENAIDGNLSTIFTGTAAAEDFITYKFTEGTKYHSISVLQDPDNISDAIVSVLTDDGYVTIGKLDESAKTFTFNQETYALESANVSEVFSDIKAGAWYENSVQFVYDNGLMSGSNGLFNPTADITRAQIVTTLYRLAGEPEVTNTSAISDFTDVAEGKYYTDAVCWAYANGIATGNNGKFDPTGKLTRQQMAAFFFRYADVMGMDTTERGEISSMLNADKVSGYAKEPVEWAVGAGLISGSEVTVNGNKVKDLNPRGNTTRAQVATILQRFCEKLDETPEEEPIYADHIYGLKIAFEKETDISIYEIYLDADQSEKDDIGEYVEPIILLPSEEVTAPSNIAFGKPVTVSGTSDGDKAGVNDGTDAKWDSDPIKGSNAKENSWVYIDLGADKTSIFDSMKIKYFNKIYPTLMEVQISNDGKNWTTVSEFTREHNGATYPVVDDVYEPALTARYVRLFFEELNSAAAGNGVGIIEWEIKGITLSNVSVKSVAKVDGIQAAVNTSAENLNLPVLVKVVLKQSVVGDVEVLVPVTWNTANYDGSTAGTYTLEGTLNLPGTVSNSGAFKASVTVTVQ